MSKYDTHAYSVTTATKSLANRAALAVRIKIFRKLKALVDFSQTQTVLDVGVTADRGRIESNFFENMFPYPDRITALSDQNASWMEQQFPGLRFVQGDGRSMPFLDNSFDLVFSSAVLEHVGSHERQCDFICECLRVARRCIFLTTPNRLHPLEFHTALPVLHWLPRDVHRMLLSALGMKELAQEENLNLLSAGDIKRMCHTLGISNYTLTTVSFLGLPSNLLLCITKTPDVST